jgi:hypothetical protein
LTNSILKRFKPLLGNPCWGVHHGYGRVLKLEFGAPRLVIREPRASRAKSKRVRELLASRSVFVVGAWSLWTWDCRWSITNRGRLVGNSKTDKRAAQAARFLDGQRLKRLTFTGNATIFDFDLGARLVTRPQRSSGEQWHLRCPKDFFLHYYSDRTHTYAHGSIPTQEGR